MENSVRLVLIGGLISLVSTLAGIALKHWFDLHKQEHETRRYPAEVLFNKQTEFYDKVFHIIPKINGYITAVDVWLWEKAPDANRKAKITAMGSHLHMSRFFEESSVKKLALRTEKVRKRSWRAKIYLREKVNYVILSGTFRLFYAS